MARRTKKTLVESAQDMVEQVTESAQEIVAQVSEAAKDGADHVTPALGAVIEGAKEKADHITPTLEAVLDSAKERVDAALHHEEPAPSKRGGKLRKVLLFGGLAALLGFAAKKFRDSRSSSDNWQSSYTPPAAPTTTPKPAAAPVPPVAETPTHEAPVSENSAPETPAEDAGGANPAEALSDAAEAPHEVTTPDEPAEVIDVEDVPKG